MSEKPNCAKRIVSEFETGGHVVAGPLKPRARSGGVRTARSFIRSGTKAGVARSPTPVVPRASRRRGPGSRTKGLGRVVQIRAGTRRRPDQHQGEQQDAAGGVRLAARAHVSADTTPPPPRPRTRAGCGAGIAAARDARAPADETRGRAAGAHRAARRW